MTNDKWNEQVIRRIPSRSWWVLRWRTLTMNLNVDDMACKGGYDIVQSVEWVSSSNQMPLLPSHWPSACLCYMNLPFWVVPGKIRDRWIWVLSFRPVLPTAPHTHKKKMSNSKQWYAAFSILSMNTLWNLGFLLLVQVDTNNMIKRKFIGGCVSWLNSLRTRSVISKNQAPNLNLQSINTWPKPADSEGFELFTALIFMLLGRPGPGSCNFSFVPLQTLTSYDNFPACRVKARVRWFPNSQSTIEIWKKFNSIQMIRRKNFSSFFFFGKRVEVLRASSSRFWWLDISRFEDWQLLIQLQVFESSTVSALRTWLLHPLSF